MSPAPPPPFRHVDSTADVAALAEALCAPTDMTPTLVVTAVNRTREIPLDLTRIADEVGDAAHLVTITDPDLTRTLTGLMPPGTTPYNGAARIYPAHDLTWIQDCFAGDLLFANIRPDNGTRLAGALATRLLTMAENARGYEALDALAERSAGAAGEDAGPRPFRGEFTGASSATVGMITSPDAPGVGMLRVDLDALRPGAPVVIGSVFADGDEVTGHFDASGAVVDVDGMRTVGQMAADLEVQHRYPAVVTGVVAKSQVSVQVVPGLTSHLTQTGIDSSVSAGDVVTVQVQSVGERRGALKIVVGPVPDGAAVEDAPPLRVGGPAWVTLKDAATDEDATDTGDTGDTGDAGDADGGVPAGSVAELEGLRARVPTLKKHLRRMEDQIAELHRRLRTYDDERRFAWDENDRLEEENDLLRARLRSAGVALPAGVASGEAATTARAKKTEKRTVYTERPLMGDEFDTLYWQLFTEVQLCWARQVDAADKHAHPLNFRYGDGFLVSVTRTVKDSEALRWKLPKVMAWVGCGLPERTTRHHAYRDGEGGGAPQLVRDDGSKAFRVDLETKTAAARRLHYWRLPDGTVEFHRVGFHDEPGF